MRIRYRSVPDSSCGITSGDAVRPPENESIIQMEIKYVLMDPTGNRTILVETPVPPEDRPDIAAALMKLEPSAEQVGFLSEYGQDTDAGTDLALRMAGGEFCGNASMSAAVWYGIRSGSARGTFSVSVSGAADPVQVTISSRPDGLWQGIVDMPGPESVETVRFPDGRQLPVVSFSGISHVILEQSMNPETAERLVKEWCCFLHADALGLLFLQPDEENTASPAPETFSAAGGPDRLTRGHLTPLVYVPAADTLFWESACGSGTTAVGAWLARIKGGPVRLSLQQPGGELEISAAPGSPLLLKGTVRCVHERTADIPPEQKK